MSLKLNKATATTTSHKSYFAQMVVATAFVVLGPMVAVWQLRVQDVVSTFLACLVCAIILTVVASVTGAAVWKRNKASGDILFSELLLWGWLRRRRIQRELHDTMELLHQEATDPVERIALMKKLAAALDAEDPYLHGHSRRVARYATLVARKMHRPSAEIATIQNAGILHDIGKIEIDRKILLKRSRLNDEEFEEMKRHPAAGARFIGADMAALAKIVRHHHEKFDGTGYPDGLVGEEIPLGARIIAVVDTFDAIISPRPYRPGAPHKKALDILVSEANHQLDAGVVHAFLAVYNDRRTGAWALGMQQSSTAWARKKVTVYSSIGFLSAVLAVTLGSIAIPIHHNPSTPIVASKGVINGGSGGGNPHPGGG